MSKNKLLNLFALANITFFLIAIPYQSHAATKGKATVAHPAKEKVILMPMDITVEDKSMISDMQNAVEQGLRQKYQVFSGEAVLSELKKAADKENRSTKKSCDETRCLQDVAMAFDNAYVAMVHVKQIAGGYTLSINILDVFTNESVFPNQISCKGCDSFQLLDKLKELVGAPSARTSTPVPALEEPQAKVNLTDPEIALWEEAKKGNAEEDYQAYLTTYPKGRYIALAQARIDKIKREMAAADAKRKQEQVAEAEKQKREAGNGPAMIHIPGKNYEIGKYDVTQKEWQAIMGSNPSKFKSCGDNCPVEQVSWNDIQEFLQKLNAKTGKQYRLPSEDEWEYACNGGNKTEYCGGNDLNAVAWYKDNSNSTTHPVGQKQANGYGLYDMSGNVWQWLENESGSGRALRGGSWFLTSDFLPAVFRLGSAPASQSSDYGFRLARTFP